MSDLSTYLDADLDPIHIDWIGLQSNDDGSDPITGAYNISQNMSFFSSIFDVSYPKVYALSIAP